MNAEQELKAAATPDLALDVEKAVGQDAIVPSLVGTESIAESSEPAQSTPTALISDLTQESATVNDNVTSVEAEKT